MNIWASIKGIFTGNFIQDLGNAIDANITSDEERLRLHNQLSSITNQAHQSLERIKLDFEKEVSQRHKLDMQSDSWLSKNIRPLALIYLLLLVTVLAIIDSVSNNITVAEMWIDLFKLLLVMVFTFYFSSRGIEKIVSMLKKDK